ncbi:MAG: hypothetical protein CMF31_00425 [Kordiimonas sp.]|nr:hypothetical protein [Kordiimonas sp.]
MSIEIIPNWHPIFVHFSVALLSVSGVMFLASTLLKKEQLFVVARWNLWLGVAITIGTVAAGFYAYNTVAHDGPSHAAMTDHRNWALGAASLFALLAVWSLAKHRTADKASPLFIACILIATGLLAVTGFKGGEAVYRHGLGVMRMPEVSGDGGHGSHSHGEGEEHGAIHNEHQKEETSPEHNSDHAHGDHNHEEENAHNSTHDTETAIIEEFINPLEPAGVVKAFREALKNKDEDAIRALLLPDVFISEGGNAERSLDEYASHHMVSDMEFVAAVEDSVNDQQVHVSGDTAWIVTEIVSNGLFRGTNVHSKLMETMVLTNTKDGWRVAHIHWSSGPASNDSKQTSKEDDGHGDHEH